MKTYSNKVIDPKKKKSSVTMTVTPGKEKSEYKSTRVLSGHPEYGKEKASNKDAKFIEDARKKKEDVVYKDGKPYRAGTTTTTKEKDKVAIDVKVEHPKFKMVPAKEKGSFKEPGASKTKKLKPMAMTYGTDSPTKGGGTKYKNKVKSLLGR